MKQIKLTIPKIPPSINSAYIRTKFGSRIINREGKEFKKLVKKCIENQIKEDKYPVFDSYVQVDIKFFVSPAYKYTDSDIDNRLKILMDAIEDKVCVKRKYTYYGKIFKDDKQIDKLIVERIIDYRYHRTEITITEHIRKIIRYRKVTEQTELI